MRHQIRRDHVLLGSNSYGKLGDGSQSTKLSPTLVRFSDPSTEVVKMGLGDYNTCAITSSGRVFCWGHNNYGQLGVGSTTTPSFSSIQRRFERRGHRMPWICHWDTISPVLSWLKERFGAGVTTPLSNLEIRVSPHNPRFLYRSTCLQVDLQHPSNLPIGTRAPCWTMEACTVGADTHGSTWASSFANSRQRRHPQ